MLPLRKHWHFAFKHSPEQEARLLGFSTGGTPPSDPTFPRIFNPDAEDENQQTETPESTEQPEKSVEAMDTNELLRTMIGLQRKQMEKTAKKDSEAEKAQKDQLETDAESAKKESVRTRIADMIEAISKHQEKVEELHRKMDDPDLKGIIENYAQAQTSQEWAADLVRLKTELEEVAKEKLFAEAISKFWDGDIAPSRFLAEQEQYLAHLPTEMQEFGTLLHTVLTKANTEREPAISTEEWNLKQTSDRITTAQTYLKNADMDDWLLTKQKQYRNAEDHLKKQEEWIEKIEKWADNADPSGKNAPPPQGILKTLRKIRLYSINDYIQGGKKTWAALTSTWEARSERYSADIARKFGKALQPFNLFPIYGEEVASILDQQLDAKSNEEAEAMKKQLENDHAKWPNLFAPGGVFLRFAGSNPNKTRGILDYAAEHGFLYDLDENLEDHSHPIYGYKLSDICFDWHDNPAKIENYFTSLRGKNSQGREHEIEHGYKMEYDNADVPRFIHLVEHELHDHNLWAAAGVCKRAIERGLEGEVSAWLFQTIMENLRKYPDLERVVPVEFFDIVGKLSMYSTAFTLGWAKLYRRQLRNWAKKGDETVLDRTELKFFAIIKQDIRDKEPNYDWESEEGQKRMNRLVAQVFACQIVKLDGGYVHIFETKYKPYRDKARKIFASVADPHKEDSDYARETTEKTMLPLGVVKDILKYTSTFEFTGGTWTEAYFGSIIGEARKLKDIPALHEAYLNYTSEIRYTMDQHFNSYKHEDRAVKQLSTMDPTTNKPAIASMIAENLLSWDIMKKSAFARAIAPQLQKHFPDFYLKYIANDTDFWRDAPKLKAA